MKKEVTEISLEAMAILENHDFPGNVRELENIIERGLRSIPASQSSVAFA